MEIIEFVNVIVKRIKEKVGKECTVKGDLFVGNNGVKKYVVIINDGKTNMSPCVDVGVYLEKVKSNELSIDSVAEDILRCYRDYRCQSDLDVENFFNYNEIKSRLYCKLINTDKNHKLLEDIPHREYLDLSIVYYVYFDNIGKSEISGSVLIHNSHMNLWKVDEKMLYETALNNLEKQVLFKNFGNVMADIMGLDLPEMNDIMPMYVLSNNNHMYGAIHMCNEKIMGLISEQLNSDLVLLPSSTHEVLIIPLSLPNDEDYLDFATMVREVNDTQVEQNEILSYHVYYYSRENRSMKIVA